MPNPLFNAIGSLRNMTGPIGNMQNIMSQARQFQQNFQGNAQQQVQQMLNSGQVSQSRYNEAVQLTNQIYRMMGGK